MNQERICDPSANADKGNRSYFIKEMLRFLTVRATRGVPTMWAPPVSMKYKSMVPSRMAAQRDYKPSAAQIVFASWTHLLWTDTGTLLKRCKIQIQVLFQMSQTFLNRAVKKGLTRLILCEQSDCTMQIAMLISYKSSEVGPRKPLWDVRCVLAAITTYYQSILLHDCESYS